MAKRGPKAMTAEHKAALEKGRQQGRVVRRYLDLLDLTKPKRGRKSDPEQLEKKAAALQKEIDETQSSVDKLTLLSELREIQGKLDEIVASERALTEMEEATADFIKIAADYSESKGFDTQTWLDVGVPRKVLAEAGMTGRRKS